MTRRKFIYKLMVAGSVSVAGFAWLARESTKRVLFGLCSAGKAAPRKFVRAYRAKKYPGPVKPLGDISEMSKWSG